MFRNRTSSQKPGDEFIANFRQSFPEIAVATTTAGTSSGETTLSGVTAGGPRADRHHSLGGEDIKDLDPTPKAQHEPWRFTPSLLDPNSFAFTTFANQPPGYYTPTPGGVNLLYHSQAGDLHTPGMGMGMGLGTPLSLPSSTHGLHSSSMMDMSAFSHHMPPHFQNYNPFAQQQQHSQQPHHQPQQQSYAPSSFVHQDTTYEPMDHDGSPLDEDDRRMTSLDVSMQHQSPLMVYQSGQYELGMAPPFPTSAEKFRFHVTLNAPTAMIKQSDEIPVTYLNKGQAYSISIVDTAPSLPLPHGSRYRTFIRISFEDEQQRQRPEACWQLWKEGRGTNEAHQRGGKLQAVEYVEANQPAVSDDMRTRVDLDTASFDGFSFFWTPGANGSTECNVAVRFNFLSTDFSHSKGVKGIPVRFCAKTETVATGSPRSAANYSEVAYCKVKLFRDHGAERKLSNDVAHVKKTIDKLKQQIAQAETGMKDFGKRKRPGSVASKARSSQRSGKVQKHKRTWSISSASSAGGKVPAEDDLHFKLQTMQDMFTSTRPVSILYLRGSELDDPDFHPVTLVGEPLDLTKVDSAGSALWQQRSDCSSITETSSMISPSSSSVSLRSQGFGAPVQTAPTQWVDFSSVAPAEIRSSNPQLLASPPDQLTKVTTKKSDKGRNLVGWIEALGVDQSYQAPAERAIKPAACFYVLYRDRAQPERHEYHRAIYLPQKTLKDLIHCMSMKWDVDLSKVVRTIHILDRGLRVEVDDIRVREMAEGQDLIFDLVGLDQNGQELEMPVDADGDVVVDSENASDSQNVVQAAAYVQTESYGPAEAYELRLWY